MTSLIHLIRHGHHPLLGTTLCGRMTGVQLDPLGCQQMAHCAELIWPAPVAIQTSPQQRCMQSAAILSERFGLAIEIVPALDEIDYGDWTGLSFAELDRDPRWSSWNARRGASRPPGGESMRALQRRIVAHLKHVAKDGSTATMAMVSHAEPIRAALLYYAGIALDDFLSIEVDPASASTLVADETGLHITEINQRVPA